VFVQRELREAIARSIDPGRRQELHARWADWLLARAASDEAAAIDGQLEAGWHLVHTERALQGADLLAKVGPELVQRRVAMMTAIPAIERALELYELHGRPVRDCLYLRALLVMSSYLFDQRLADRYANTTLDALYPFTGLALVERLSRYLGRNFGFVVAQTWTILCWCFRFGRRRGPHAIEALKNYARSTMGLIGLRALASDTQRLRWTLDRMRMFKDSPLPILSLIHDLAEAITANAEGRFGEAKRLIEHVVARLDTGPPVFTSVQEHTDLLTGALLLKGINASYRENSDALKVAKRLESIGTQLAAAAAIRVCMTYHLSRAEHVATQQYRRSLDLQAIQHGTQWQIDLIEIPIEGLTGVTWNDLPMLSRALNKIEQLSTASSAFHDMRETIRIDYNFRRGDFAKVTKLGDAYLERHAPGSFISWPVIYASVAFAYGRLGKLERARAICEHAFQHLNVEDRDYIVLILPLEAAYATTLALLGERERAEEILQTRLARQQAAGDHVRAFQVLEHRLEMLRLLGDEPEQARTLSLMRDEARASGNPHLTTRVENLFERPTHHESPPPAANDQFEPSNLDADETSAVDLPDQRKVNGP
jgi:tetratricopeptide (TPR) repeat protein